jgi:hypothetical protein
LSVFDETSIIATGGSSTIELVASELFLHF